MSRRGQVLLEVLLAASILAAILVPMLASMNHSLRAVSVGGEYTDALALAQQSAEDLLYSSFDADSEEALHAVRTSGPVPLSGVDHPFRLVLEDSAVPWSRLERQVDIGLDSRAGETFRQYEQFSLKIESGAPAPDGTTDAVATLSCALSRGRTRDFAFPLFLSFSAPGAELPGEPLVLDALAVPDSPVFATAPWPGHAHPEVLRDLESLATTTQILSNADDATAAKLAAARSAISTNVDSPGDLAALELTSAVELERRAVLSRAALLTSEAPVARLLNTLTRRSVEGTDFERLAVTLRLLTLVEERGARFHDDLRAALAAYTRARRALARDVQRQRLLAVDRKVLDLATLRELALPGRDDFAREWVEFLAQEYAGRNRWLESQLDVTRQLLQEPLRLRRRYAGAALTLDRISKAEAAVRALRERALRELS